MKLAPRITLALTLLSAVGAGGALNFIRAPFVPRFTSPSAAWLYSPPRGAHRDISALAATLTFSVNTHAEGFDYPVQYTDGSHGCTLFTDTLRYDLHDRTCVPNPAAGYAPSHGGWGANDGHLVVVDTSTGNYYDFWKLEVDAAGRPLSTNVGAIFTGNLATSNGTPGSTAAGITGLAGDILPGELDCATCLNHALNAAIPGLMNSSRMGHQFPATKTDGRGHGFFREGAKIRLDPRVDVSKLPASTAARAILRALQLYGGAITDQSGGTGIGFYSALAAPPDLTGLDLIRQHLWIYY